MRWHVCLLGMNALLFIINDLSETNGYFRSRVRLQPLQIMGSNGSGRRVRA
jgi:hypothetical protein